MLTAHSRPFMESKRINDGDVLEWDSLNSWQRGTVETREDGERLVRLPDGKTFFLRDLLTSSKAYIIEQ